MPIVEVHRKTEVGEITLEQMKANVHLITAAPELLKEMKNCLSIWEALGPNTEPWLVGARAAIAKAEGREL